MPELRIVLVGDGVGNVTIAKQSSPLRTGDTASIQDLSGSLRVETLTERPGISKKELALTISISFGAGVPSGVVANWIWSKLTQQGDHALVVEQAADIAEPTSQAELEALIVRLMDEHQQASQPPK